MVQGDYRKNEQWNLWVQGGVDSFRLMIANNDDVLKDHIRHGIPCSFRSYVWSILLGSDLLLIENGGLFQVKLLYSVINFTLICAAFVYIYIYVFIKNRNEILLLKIEDYKGREKKSLPEQHKKQPLKPEPSKKITKRENQKIKKIQI